MSLRLDGDTTTTTDDDDDAYGTGDHYGWLFPADLSAGALKTDLAAVGMVMSHGDVSVRPVPGGAFCAALRQASANGKSLLPASREDAALARARFAFTRAHQQHDDAARIIVRVALRNLRWLPPAPGSRRAAEEGGALLALAPLASPPAAGP